MATPQICRFQQRVLNLQSHHHSASVRHMQATEKYINSSQTLMNCLLANLKVSDKSVKKAKRITRPKVQHTQIKKQSRFNCGTSDYPVHVGTNALDPSHKESTEASTVLSEKLSMDNHTSSSNISSHTNEPIFPPPTFAEPIIRERNPLIQYDVVHQNTCSPEFWNNGQSKPGSTWSVVVTNKGNVAYDYPEICHYQYDTTSYSGNCAESHEKLPMIDIPCYESANSDRLFTNWIPYSACTDITRINSCSALNHYSSSGISREPKSIMPQQIMNTCNSSQNPLTNQTFHYFSGSCASHTKDTINPILASTYSYNSAQNTQSEFDPVHCPNHLSKYSTYSSYPHV